MKSKSHDSIIKKMWNVIIRTVKSHFVKLDRPTNPQRDETNHLSLDLFSADDRKYIEKLINKDKEAEEGIKLIMDGLNNGDGTEIGICHDDLPDRFKENIKILCFERYIGLRKALERGFDVINQVYFVHESYFGRSLITKRVCNKETTLNYTNFNDYNEYLDGNIYEQACYYQCSDPEYSSRVDETKVNKKCLIEHDIDYYTFDYKPFWTGRVDFHDLSYKSFPDISPDKYILEKEYYKNKFKVKQYWINNDNMYAKKITHEFEHFFDFVAFLKGDLSGMDLVRCDGLINLYDISNLKFDDTLLTSRFCDKFNIPYKAADISFENSRSFSCIIHNETITENVLINPSDKIMELENTTGISKVHYITDLHILHKLQQYDVKSNDDIACVVGKIVENITNDVNNILLIGGDIASDRHIFAYFVRMLRRELDDHRYSGIKVFFVLGNHELWDFRESELDVIISKYRELLKKYGMYLVHNDIWYIDGFDRVNNISTDDLTNLSNNGIRERLRTSKITIFGGIGFSGCNQDFNADTGIYNSTISREVEIAESKKFNSLYSKVLNAISDKKVIVLTHMPMSSWSNNLNYQPGYIYVSGHTHENVYFDDGDTRIYADNQIGYKNNNTHLKWFYLDTYYDCFEDLPDGIHDISIEDYKLFYRGKNIPMKFNRPTDKIIMLKRSGYYCFILPRPNKLLILHGGAVKSLDYSNIDYYYKNMDKVIQGMLTPLDEYTRYQKNIASEIKLIGGDGSIHGCIVDIDFYNHLYINPFDYKVTAYWAKDITNKLVYPDIPSLLLDKCPTLYEKYKGLIADESNKFKISTLDIKNDLINQPQKYLETDIYKANIQINKMQRLYKNILTKWNEPNESKQKTSFIEG